MWPLASLWSLCLVIDILMIYWLNSKLPRHLHHQLTTKFVIVYNMENLVDFLKITFHLSSIGNTTLKKLRNGAFWLLIVLNAISLHIFIPIVMANLNVRPKILPNLLRFPWWHAIVYQKDFCTIWMVSQKKFGILACWLAFN